MDKTMLTSRVGATETLTATVLPKNAADRSVQFSSNDTAVVTVTPVQGKVTGVAAGTATVIGTTVNGKAATYKVTVAEAGGGA